METNFNFLQEWREAFMPSLASFQAGFKQLLKEQLEAEAPKLEFIHSLCHKIDVHKKLYSDYDPHFQKAITEDLLNEPGWEAVFLLLAFCLSKLSLKKPSDKAIAFKCINSLLKLRDNMPESLKCHDFISFIYNQLLPLWLSKP